MKFRPLYHPLLLAGVLALFPCAQAAPSPDAIKRRDFSDDLRNFNQIVLLLHNIRSRIGVPSSALLNVKTSRSESIEIKPLDLALVPSSNFFSNAPTDSTPSDLSPNFMVEIDGDQLIVICADSDDEHGFEWPMMRQCSGQERVLKDYLADLRSRGSRLAVPRERIQNAPLLEFDSHRCMPKDPAQTTCSSHTGASYTFSGRRTPTPSTTTSLVPVSEFVSSIYSSGRSMFSLKTPSSIGASMTSHIDITSTTTRPAVLSTNTSSGIQYSSFSTTRISWATGVNIAASNSSISTQARPTSTFAKGNSASGSKSTSSSKETHRGTSTQSELNSTSKSTHTRAGSSNSFPAASSTRVSTSRIPTSTSEFQHSSSPSKGTDPFTSTPQVVTPTSSSFSSKGKTGRLSSTTKSSHAKITTQSSPSSTEKVTSTATDLQALSSSRVTSASSSLPMTATSSPSSTHRSVFSTLTNQSPSSMTKKLSSSIQAVVAGSSIARVSSSSISRPSAPTTSKSSLKSQILTSTQKQPPKSSSISTTAKTTLAASKESSKMSSSSHVSTSSFSKSQSHQSHVSSRVPTTTTAILLGSSSISTATKTHPPQTTSAASSKTLYSNSFIPSGSFGLASSRLTNRPYQLSTVRSRVSSMKKPSGSSSASKHAKPSTSSRPAMGQYSRTPAGVQRSSSESSSIKTASRSVITPFETATGALRSTTSHNTFASSKPHFLTASKSSLSKSESVSSTRTSKLALPVSSISSTRQSLSQKTRSVSTAKPPSSRTTSVTSLFQTQLSRPMSSHPSLPSRSSTIESASTQKSVSTPTSKPSLPINPNLSRSSSFPQSQMTKSTSSSKSLSSSNWTASSTISTTRSPLVVATSNPVVEYNTSPRTTLKSSASIITPFILTTPTTSTIPMSGSGLPIPTTSKPPTPLTIPTSMRSLDLSGSSSSSGPSISTFHTVTSSSKNNILSASMITSLSSVESSKTRPTKTANPCNGGWMIWWGEKCDTGS